ncbi:hepatic leukemia factor isoform X1 [Carettochelys insculpta]|uniref:hepatic leukemia factor isoform X1 n=1 Tax=Carettochelys insculpta TaxID=44489 RepID=UPI003EBD6EF1
MARPLPLHPPFLPPTYGVLKSLLENPLKLPLHHEDAFGKEKDKEKKLDDDSTGASVPQSAFLGPTLWDKTLPYDGDTFQLEYMDLEEFLSENGIPPSPAQHDHSPHQPNLQTATSAAPSVMDLSNRASTSVHPGMVSQNCLQSPVRPGQILPTNRNTPSPVDPETIQVPVGYEPDPADLALSSIPGQEMFDPRKRKFSEEELKPQPMIKKARKVFIPEDLKVVRTMNTLLLHRLVRFGDPDAAIVGFASLGFPNCFGALDGTHIPIRALEHSGGRFLNRKGYHSVVLQAMVDSWVCFLDIYVGWPGRTHDARVFRNSGLCCQLEAGTYIPQREIPLGDTTVPLCLVTDVAYPLWPWLMRSYTGHLSASQEQFNTPT